MIFSKKFDGSSSRRSMELLLEDQRIFSQKIEWSSLKRSVVLLKEDRCSFSQKNDESSLRRSINFFAKRSMNLHPWIFSQIVDSPSIKRLMDFLEEEQITFPGGSIDLHPEDQRIFLQKTYRSSPIFLLS